MNASHSASQYRCVNASSEQERRLVYKLRYRAYYSSRRISAREDELFYDAYDEQESSTLYLLYAGDTPAGSIRACTYLNKPNWDAIPTFGLYREEISAKLGFDKSLVELNRLAIAPEHRRISVRSHLLLFKAVVRQALERQADYLLAAVQPKHVAFYRALCFTPLSRSKKYPELDIESVLMAASLTSDNIGRLRASSAYYAQLFDEHLDKCAIQTSANGKALEGWNTKRCFSRDGV
jgi:GNAT superfamily N-acetyltransferase